MTIVILDTNVISEAMRGSAASPSVGRGCRLCQPSP